MKKRKILAMILISAFCLTIFSGGISASGSDVVQSVNEDSRFLSNQDVSNDAYNKMLQAFVDEGKCGIEEYYPDYYAGAYIGEDGNLIILTKGASDNNRKALNKICGLNSVEYKTAKYSFNELVAVKDIVSSRGTTIMEGKMFNCTALSVSVRDNYNKIFIGISDLENKELIEYLTEGIDSSLYELYKTEAPQEYGNYLPGSYIHGVGGGSAGYKAKLTVNGVKKIGFVTAAHVTGGGNIYTGWTHSIKIGNMIVEQNSGSVDAAFVELTGSNTFTNQVDGYNITAGVSVIPAIGGTVYKIGDASQTTSGTCLSNINSTQWLINGTYVTFTNLCETTAYSTNGDSGGLMYTKNGTTYKVIGVIKGGNDTTCYATKHSYLPWTISVIS